MRKVFLTTLRATATVFVADDSFVSIDIGYGCRANPALPFLLLPASRTATRAVLPVEQNVERRTCAHLACPHHRYVRTDSGRAPPHIPALPGIRRTQGFPMACLIV
jgi:hypothetical protein